MKNRILAGVCAVALSIGAVAYANQPVFSSRSDTYAQLDLFARVVDIVQKKYVVPVDSKKLIESALEGMLASLDPHSGYLDTENFTELRERTSGTYGGIGLEVQGEDGAVKVVTPMDDTPAMRAGIQSGDYITAINGTSIIGLRLNDAVSQMKGEPKTTLTLTIYRPGKDDPFDVTLTREIITVRSVKTRIEGDYGYLRIASFQENTAQDARDGVASLLNDFKKQGKTMKGLVLDLRNNPGGLLEQSVCVADIFLASGEIVSQRGRNPNEIERFQAERPGCTRGDMIKGLPMVVLINPGSASAAEIVAGALQDHHRASIVGLTSFGKGSVQQVIPLDSTRAVKLTTARYYTPSGRSIQKTGIEPDLEVAQSREQARYIATSALQYTEAAYSNALDSDEGKVRRSPHAVQEVPPDDFNTQTGDFGLVRALDVLSYGGDVAQAAAHPRGQPMTDADLTDKPGSRFEGKTHAPGAAATSSSATSSSSSSASSPSADH